MEQRMKSKGDLESEISAAVIRFKRDYLGRGPREVRAFLVEDMVLIRLKGVMTPAEQCLALVDDKHRGRDLIKQLRIELLEHGKEILESAIEAIIGIKIVSMHTDISTKSGESVIVFTLERKV